MCKSWGEFHRPFEKTIHIFRAIDISFDLIASLTSFLECTKYQVLNDFTRAQGYSLALYRCDTTLAAQPTWYRFTGRSGSQMPTSCVPTNRCGTHAPGWLAGCHPPLGKISTDLVCFHWHGDCCRWHTFIRVRNCGGFFVYELKKPPACYLRYCGNSGHK